MGNKLVFLNILIFFVIVTLFPSKIFANELFNDDFNVFPTDSWRLFSHQNETHIITEGQDTFLRLSSPNDHELPLLLVNKDFSNLEHYSIEIRYRKYYAGFGSGFILTDKLLTPYSAKDLPDNDYILMIWPQPPIGNGVGIYSQICSTNDQSCTFSPGMVFGFSDAVWHNVKFYYTHGKYLVYVDGKRIFESKITDRKIKYIYFGSPHNTATVVPWPIHDLDYIRINDFPSKTKIIVIPGLGSSWDIPAMLSGQKGNNWHIPSFITIYNNLLDSLENSGYKQGDDLFIFPYDWRRPLNDLAQQLGAFIIGHTGTNDKVDLIGHSMGGLVERAYAQTYGTNKIDKIITAGSPNEGLIDAYGVWEGAQVFGNTWWERASLELASEISRQPLERKIDSIRRQAPSIKDLMPTYEFLSFDGILKPWSALLQKNDYLKKMNNSEYLLDPFITTISGNVGGNSTRSIIYSEEPDSGDKTLGLWDDGKPISVDPFMYAPGDGTVTLESSHGNFSNKLSLSEYHVSLLSTFEGLSKVFDTLGINNSYIETYSDNSLSLLHKVFLVVLQSPGKLEVCNSENLCNDEIGIYHPSDKLFMLPGYKGEKIFIKIYAADLGKYHLHIGEISDKSSWYNIPGVLTESDQVNSYIYDRRIVVPSSSGSCKNFAWKLFGYSNQGGCVSKFQKNPQSTKNKHI